MPACWASCAPGVTWAPVNARNALEENLYILGNTDVEFLFYHSSFEASLPRIREACPKIRDLRLPRPAVVRRLAGAARRRRRPTCPMTPDDVAFLVSSGGTTGRPKGVQITNRNIETMNSIFWALHAGRGAAGASDGGADDPCGGRLLLPAAALWRHQHLHGHGRSRRHPGRDREAQGHAPLHAADPDLHAARPPRRRQVRLQLAAAT